jgi:hypothetical protein
MANPVVKASFFRRHTHWWAVAIVLPLIGLAVGLGIWASLSNYNGALHGTTEQDCQGKHPNNAIGIYAQIIAVDTDALTTTVRLDFIPIGNIVNENQSSNSYETLTRSITMVTTGLLAQPAGSQSSADPSAGPPSYVSPSSSYVFVRGDYIQDLDVDVPLVPGTLSAASPPGSSSARYPWDTYVDASTPSFQFRQGIGTTGKYIPACLDVASSVGGWAVAINTSGSSTAFDVSFARSAPVKFYSFFVIGLMWALALGGVAMAVIMIMRKQDEIDTAAFAYLAALLFAFPLIRQTLPGNPGPGSLIDIVAYYWTEVIVAVTLVVLLVRWVTLKGRHERPEPDDDEVVEPVDPIVL